MNRPTITTIVIVFWIVLVILSIFGPALGIGISPDRTLLVLLGIAILMLR